MAEKTPYDDNDRFHIEKAVQAVIDRNFDVLRSEINDLQADSKAEIYKAEKRLQNLHDDVLDRVGWDEKGKVAKRWLAAGAGFFVGLVVGGLVGSLFI